MLAKRDPVYQFKHKMPISAGVTVSKSLPRNWELESGLVYTYLYSKYYSTKGNGSQELHYLGIPLNVILPIRPHQAIIVLCLGRWTSRLLPWPGRQKDEEHDGAVSGSGYKELKHENVQFSVQANVGAALTLYKAVELYLEPYMAYYFENNSSIHNIWKDKPFKLWFDTGYSNRILTSSTTLNKKSTRTKKTMKALKFTTALSLLSGVLLLSSCLGDGEQYHVDLFNRKYL